MKNYLDEWKDIQDVTSRKRIQSISRVCNHKRLYSAKRDVCVYAGSGWNRIAAP